MNVEPTEIILNKLKQELKEIQDLQNNGEVWIKYSYTISPLITTLNRSSRIYKYSYPTFLQKLRDSLPYTLTSLFLGWWGFPWGFIFTPISIIVNLGGGQSLLKKMEREVSLKIDRYQQRYTQQLNNIK